MYRTFGTRNLSSFLGSECYRCPSISRPAISRIFGKSDIFYGNGYIYEGFIHVKKDPTFDESDIFRRESELTKTRKTANAQRTAHSRPFNCATLPTDAPAKKYRSRKTSGTCLMPNGRGSEETRGTKVCRMGTIQTWVTLLESKCLQHHKTQGPKPYTWTHQIGKSEWA